MVKSAIEAVPALLASPAAAAALAGGAVIVVGIAGVVYYLDQQNQRLLVEKILEDQKELVHKLLDSGNFIVSSVTIATLIGQSLEMQHFAQVEFHESGMIRKITPFQADPGICKRQHG